jgi:hypothetical protein
MTKNIRRLVCASGLAGVIYASTGCAQPVTPTQVVKTVLDVAQYACIIANADLPSSSAVIATCNVDQTLTPVVEAILSNFGKAKREALAKAMAAGHCSQ